MASPAASNYSLEEKLCLAAILGIVLFLASGRRKV
jgi:hypothetical protein